MNLKETQELFKRLLLEPKAEVPSGLIAAGNGRLTVEERLHIYRVDYRGRMVESLAETFPNVMQVLGGDDFQALALRYIERVPSQHYDLGLAGQALPAFLQEDEVGRALAFLPDLARAEWLLFICFQEDFLPPLNPATLVSKSEADLARARFSFQPSLRHFQTHWPLPSLLGLHLESQKGKPVPERHSEPLYLAIGQRIEGGTFWQTIDAAEAVILTALRQGLTLECACGALGSDAAPQLQNWFSSWLQKGWITALSC